MKKMTNWKEFETFYSFEQVVYDLTLASLKLMQKSKVKEEEFCSFAFNCNSFYGSLILSFDTDVANKARGYYPPDWSHEEIDIDVPKIGELWQKKYEVIEFEYFKIADNLDTETELEAFSKGFLHSLRCVMARIEYEQILEKNLKTTEFIWTLVTEIDADEEEEERLLEEVRLSLK